MTLAEEFLRMKRKRGCEIRFIKIQMRKVSIFSRWVAEVFDFQSEEEFLKMLRCDHKSLLNAS